MTIGTIVNLSPAGGAASSATAWTHNLTGGPSAAGDTLLAVMMGAGTDINVSPGGFTDSAGNTWVRDGYSAASPYSAYFRCPGATGGPGGGPTAPAGAGTSLPMTGSGGTATNLGCGCWAVRGLRPLRNTTATGGQVGFTVNGGCSGQPVCAIAVPGMWATLPSDDAVVLCMWQSAGGAAQVSPPWTLHQTIVHNHSAALAWASAEAAMFVLTLAATANSRICGWQFGDPPPRQPRVWDGTRWRLVTAGRAQLYDGTRWAALK
jgi:hypothetical protein